MTEQCSGYSGILDAADYLEERGIKTLPRRDKRDPGRRRKELADAKLFKIMQRYFRQQKQRIRDILEAEYPERKGVTLPMAFNSAYDNKEIEAQLRALLFEAALDGTVLFLDSSNIVFDGSILNPYAINWAKQYAGELIKGIDKTTQSAVQSAISAFAETPGMTIGDVMNMLPFSDRRSEMIATTEITRSYAQGQLIAGSEMQKENPGVKVIKTWYTNMDERVCDICAPLEGQERELNEQFDGGYDAPPSHPGCFCNISTSTALAELD